MKSLIVYLSVHHANTEKIAIAMAGVLDAKLVKSKDVDINKLSEYDLIGFGSGIYNGKHHKSLLKLADKLPNLKAKKVFVFSTSGMSNAGNFIHNIRHKVCHFHTPLKKKLVKKGLDIVGEFSCRGWDTCLFEKYLPFLKFTGGIAKGKPDKKDIQKAIDFVKSIKEKI